MLKILRELRWILVYLVESCKGCVKWDGFCFWSEEEGLDCVVYLYKSCIIDRGFNLLWKVME